jgi:hypothetical protein
MRRYRANVVRLLAGKPYHIKGRDYRAVHHAFAALRQGRKVEIVIIENVEDAVARARREDELIRARRACALYPQKS